MNEINKPLYVQIQEYIADLILSGKLPPEAKIQSERDFSEELGVSRMTIRKALTELVNEGLLERRHGSGTYVAKPKVTYNAEELVNYTTALEARNLATVSQVLEFGQVPASRRFADVLNVEIGHPLYRVVILRFTNRVPVILERAFFPCSRCPDLEEWNLEKTSVYDLLTIAYKHRLSQVSQTVEAVAANETVAKQLRVVEGFPLLLVSRTIISKEDDKPLEFSQDFLRGDYARIHADIQLEELDE
jgi:GntR family transcriptional regulator